jgi:hypothetical protein
MISAYDKYAKEIGVIVPSEIRTEAFQKLALSSDLPYTHSQSKTYHKDKAIKP